jgi:hypothetical protein
MITNEQVCFYQIQAEVDTLREDLSSILHEKLTRLQSIFRGLESVMFRLSQAHGASVTKAAHALSVQACVKELTASFTANGGVENARYSFDVLQRYIDAKACSIKGESLELFELLKRAATEPEPCVCLVAYLDAIMRLNKAKGTVQHAGTAGALKAAVMFKRKALSNPTCQSLIDDENTPAITSGHIDTWLTEAVFKVMAHPSGQFLFRGGGTVCLLLL